jgi:hypothetical protein
MLRPLLLTAAFVPVVPLAAQEPKQTAADRAIAEATRALEAALAKEKDPAERAKLKEAIAALKPPAGAGSTEEVRKRWEAIVEMGREKLGETYTAQLDKLQEQLKAAEKKLKGATGKQATALKGEIASINQEVEKTKKWIEDVKKWEPVTTPDRLAEGELTLLRVNSTRDVLAFKVLQVIDAKTALLQWGKASYWVEMNTAGLADGDTVRLRGVVEGLGTKQFTNAAGSRRPSGPSSTTATEAANKAK